MQDAKSAQEAVSKAIEVLRDVYSGSGSFIERRDHQIPAFRWMIAHLWPIYSPVQPCYGL